MHCGVVSVHRENTSPAQAVMKVKDRRGAKRLTTLLRQAHVRHQSVRAAFATETAFLISAERAGRTPLFTFPQGLGSRFAASR